MTSRGRAVSLALVLAGCGHRAPGPSPEVWFAGCAAVRRGPVCVSAAEASLRVWIADSGDVRFTGGQVTGEAAVDGGRRFEVRLEPGAEALEASVGERVWRLPLEAPVPAPALDAAAALRKAGRLDEAAAALDAASATDPEVAARMESLRARIELARGHAEEAARLLDEAAARHDAAGLLSDASDDRQAAAYVRTSALRRFAEARGTLAMPAPDPDTYAPGAVRQVYYQGLLAARTGDLRQALALLRAAEQQARRVGPDRVVTESRVVTTSVLRALGRFDEARVVLEALRSADLEPCDRASALNNLGFLDLQVAEIRSAPAAVAPLREALALYEGACRDAHKAAIAHLHLALAALQAGDPATARAERAAVAVADAPDVDHWGALVDARIALESGHAADALALYRRLEARVDPAAAPEVAWRARVGEGRAQAALGALPAAVEAWRGAEALLDDRLLQVPLDEGRDTFVGGREIGARLLVDALVALDRPAEALAAARRSRARVLRSLQRTDRLGRLSPEAQRRWDEAIGAYQAERSALEKEAAGDWRLPDDALAAARADREPRRARLRAALDDAFAALGEAGDAGAPPAPGPGEVVLAYHPGRDGWIGFAATSAGVVARRLGALPPRSDAAGLGRALLAPFADTLAGARLVRVLPYGAVRDLDLHALPFAGGVLLDRAPVVYGLDLPAPAPAAPGNDALLVADPRGDLPAARAEADAVARALAGRFAVRRLQGETATGPAVRDALPGAELLHYAGHGIYGGRGGWASALPLAAGGELSVGDVLALPRAPRLVVLSGCETARSARDASAETIGLAQAFVAAGADAAVAASRSVDDGDAARLMAAFYADLPAGPAAALRHAQGALRRERPAADWAAFRVVVP
jgi:tetratricopeptide (TPR) repeat protein